MGAAASAGGICGRMRDEGGSDNSFLHVTKGVRLKVHMWLSKARKCLVRCKLITK